MASDSAGRPELWRRLPFLRVLLGALFHWWEAFDLADMGHTPSLTILGATHLKSGFFRAPHCSQFVFGVLVSLEMYMILGFLLGVYFRLFPFSIIPGLTLDTSRVSVCEGVWKILDFLREG